MFIGPSKNFEKLRNSDCGIDGTFTLSKVAREIDGKKIKFRQLLMVVIKHTVSVTENGVTRQKFTCEPLFAAFVTSKQKEVYISFWRRMIELYSRFYPDDGPLTLGNFYFDLNVNKQYLSQNKYGFRTRYGVRYSNSLA